MQPRRSFPVLFAFCCVLFPACVTSQFQPPTQEELTMTSDPKVPGAAAIYLYREETVDDNLHYRSYHERIKVLTEKGKELATVGIPYPKGSKFSITDVKGRTIHPDGTIVPLDVKPADLLMAANAEKGAQFNKIVFTLPSVEVGSILEYRWELRYDDHMFTTPDWDVQTKYYVRKAHYSFLPYRFNYRLQSSNGETADKLLYTSMLPAGSKVVEEASGRYTLDVSDIPPIPNEEYMPPIGAYLQHVVFYYTGFTSKDDFWKTSGGRWSKDMDHFAEQSGSLKEAVAQIVAPTDSEDAKARKLYAAVMKLDNTDFTRRKSKAELKQLGLKQIKQAEDVWKLKSGSSDEIALLYLAMARIAGLKAYAFAVADRNERLFNPYYLSLRQLDDVLVIVNIGGKDTVLDPGEKYAAFGELHWKHTLTVGLRQSDHGPVFGETNGNPYKEATTLRTADLTIAADGSVTGSIRITMGGPQALYWRQLALSDDEDEVKRQFNESIERIVPAGVHTEFDHFLGLDDGATVLMAIVKLSGNIGTATGKRVFLPGSFFATRSSSRFVTEEKRLSPVDMHYADMVTDQVTYHLPESFTVESSPQAQSVPWSGHAVLQEKFGVDKNTATMVRTFARAFTLVDPKDYPALHDFYQKVATADQQQLVLIASQVAKAN